MCLTCIHPLSFTHPILTAKKDGWGTVSLMPVGVTASPWCSEGDVQPRAACDTLHIRCLLR